MDGVEWKFDLCERHLCDPTPDPNRHPVIARAQVDAENIREPVSPQDALRSGIDQAGYWDESSPAAPMLTGTTGRRTSGPRRGTLSAT